MIAALDGKPVADAKGGIAHYTARVAATLRRRAEDLRALNTTIEELGARIHKGGAATTLSPVDAIRYLPPEQVAQHLDGWIRSQIGLAQERARVAEANQESLRMAIGRLALADSTPPTIRAQLAQLAGISPRTVGEVSEPAAPTSPTSVPADQSSTDVACAPGEMRANGEPDNAPSLKDLFE